MKNLLHLTVSSKRVRKIISAVIFSAIALTIFNANSESKIVIALGGQSGEGSSETYYTVDDIRNMYGCERKFGQKVKNELIDKARHQKLEDDQIEYIESVLGKEYKLESANVVARVNYVNSCLEGMNTAISNGYSADVVLDYYNKVLEAIAEYEIASGGTWDETKEYTNEAAFAVIDEIRAFELGVENDKVVASVLGSRMQAPLEFSNLKVPFELSQDGVVWFSNESYGIDNIHCILSGTVTRVKKVDIGDDGRNRVAVTITSNTDLHVVYYMNETNLKEMDIVKQGEIIGQCLEFSDAGILLQIDEENRDPLALFGSLGDVYKKEYMQRNPWVKLSVGKYKECPDVEEEKKVDKDSIHATLVE